MWLGIELRSSCSWQVHYWLSCLPSQVNRLCVLLFSSVVCMCKVEMVISCCAHFHHHSRCLFAHVCPTEVKWAGTLLLVSIFLMNSWYSTLSRCFCPCVSSLEKISIEILCPSFNWIILLLSYNDFLYNVYYIKSRPLLDINLYK